MKLISSVAILAACIIGKPTLAKGESDDKPAYDPTGTPLHGDPTNGGSAAKPAEPVDQTDLAKQALSATKGVTEAGTAGAGELEALLAESADLKDGTALPIDRIVEIRMRLGQFRYLGDDVARRIDEESNRLEAIILGLKVKKGSAK